MSSMGASYALLNVQRKRLQEKLHKEKNISEKDGAADKSVASAQKSEGKSKIHPSNVSDSTK
ncbi:hypothetical protein DCAR_0312996 [Daucus carota subsp. sativus]|uniref:Uncharacterized protein n=1 Tax=Daucus carota subsp. sativus TaxID=79200 RepID=A0A161Y0S6_DAUCS|nr:hypothetical protein DCAR_0312996 [Daucus carota subsp. sativus]